MIGRVGPMAKQKKKELKLKLNLKLKSLMNTKIILPFFIR